MEEIAARFGENLLHARRLVCLSQEKTALRASLHRTEIGMLEHGERLPRIDTLVKLAGALELPPGDLLRGIEWVPSSGGKPAGSFWISKTPESGANPTRTKHPT
jgi:transcriptional regulator with XRE-family HTH domain